MSLERPYFFYFRRRWLDQRFQVFTPKGSQSLIKVEKCPLSVPEPLTSNLIFDDLAWPLDGWLCVSFWIDSGFRYCQVIIIIPKAVHKVTNGKIKPISSWWSQLPIQRIDKITTLFSNVTRILFVNSEEELWTWDNLGT